LSAYGGVVVPKRARRPARRRRRASASRAASTAIETLSSSKLATLRTPFSGGTPSTSAMVVRFSRR
jgi:hypothetical protein